MNADRQLRRELLEALAGLTVTMLAVGAMVVWLLTAAGKPYVPRQEAPKVSAFDRLFEENFELIDRGMDILWRHHEVFDDLMMMEGRTSTCTVGGNGWDIHGVNHRLYMTEAEWRAVLTMYDTLNPYSMTYYPESRPPGVPEPCGAWSIRLEFHAADDARPWREGRTYLVYEYVRCTEAAHEGFDPSCAGLRREVEAQLEPMGPDWWYRGERFREWR